MTAAVGGGGGGGAQVGARTGEQTASDRGQAARRAIERREGKGESLAPAQRRGYLDRSPGEASEAGKKVGLNLTPLTDKLRLSHGEEGIVDRYNLSSHGGPGGGVEGSESCCARARRSRAAVRCLVWAVRSREQSQAGDHAGDRARYRLQSAGAECADS